MELTNPRVVRELLNKHGFRFSKSLGQNFLISERVPREIADQSGAGPGVGVLEIGPGFGCLTAQLARRAEKVVAIELDRALQPVLTETLAEYGNIELIFGDALKQDYPALIAERFGGLRPIACANLPYSVTSPALAALLEPRVFESVTVMVQREFANRVCAAPGGGDYGAFTVFCKWYAVAERLFDVAPGCFMPAPSVTSTVLLLTRLSEPPARVDDEGFFFRVVRAAFNQRRKTLLNALSSGLSLPKDRVAAAIASQGLAADIRGERLGAEEFAGIANSLVDS